MKLQLNYNEKTGELVSWSEETEKMNTGTVIQSKVVDISPADFEKLKSNSFLKTFDGKTLVFKDNQNALAQVKQKELIVKLKAGTITAAEQRELLLLFLGQ